MSSGQWRHGMRTKPLRRNEDPALSPLGGERAEMRRRAGVVYAAHPSVKPINAN